MAASMPPDAITLIRHYLFRRQPIFSSFIFRFHLFSSDFRHFLMLLIFH